MQFLLSSIAFSPDNLVGLEHHEEEMLGLLDVNFNGVLIVGVHGMGGIGKTTITKVIYNKLVKHFEFCCFLEDVREKSQHHNGLVDLQNQLVSTISKGNFSNIVDVDEGTKRIKDTVGGKKVLMVLDDIDEKFQFDKLAGNHDWFGSGSRIIVTTRNKEVLDSLDVFYQKSGLPEVYKGYEPELMNFDHSLQLFSKYAFMRDFPLEGYDTLSKQVVSTAAGLPLVIVTMGSLLFGKEDKDLWVEILRKLKKIPHGKVMGKLRISFEALEYEEKQIFLDIACLFIGEDKINPSYMWDDSRFFPKFGINVLVLRSLVKVGDNNKLWMHDHLRDLGRQIVREKNPNDPGKWTRLWRCEEALDICRTHQATENVQALSLESQNWDTTTRPVVVGEDFRKLPNLRYLSITGVNLGGDFEHCLPNLRWLQWYFFSEKDSTPINLHLKNLVILELNCFFISDEWEGWRQFKVYLSLLAFVLMVSSSYSYLCLDGN